MLLFGLIVIAPLLQPGYFWGAHDARHDVYFIFEYDQSVRDGIWFPRWGPDWAFGYGYPFWIVYGPLATFFGELFHHFGGLGFEASVKAVLGLSILACGLAMYGFVRSWLGRNAGLVAAVAYMAIPYHLVDVYVRAAMAESVALVFLPLALWGFRETVRRPRLLAILAAAAAYAAIMWTSNLVALVFTPGLALYVLALLFWRVRDGRGTMDGDRWQAIGGRVLRLALAPAIAFALGLGLSAAFFIPALLEQGYINQSQWFGAYYDPFQHFVYFNQLFNPAWGFGISQPGPNDVAQGALSYQLGAAATLFSLIALVGAARFGRTRRREIWFWGAWAAASIFLTLGISAPAWRYVPLVPFAQFPWRYLMLAILPLSILPGVLVADADGGFAWQRADGGFAWQRAKGGFAWQMAASPGRERLRLAKGKGRLRLADGGFAWQRAASPGKGQRAASPGRGWLRLADGGFAWQTANGKWQMAIRNPQSAIRNPQSAIRNPRWPALLLSTLLLLSSYSYLKVEIREPTPEQGPVSYAALMRFQRTSDEMTGVTAWVDPIPHWSPMADLWVAGEEVTTRVDYAQAPQNETLAVNAQEMGSAHDLVWYFAKDPGQSIVFNRFWYPGWTAYLLDNEGGKPVRELPVERENGPLARVVVPAPPGEGYLLLRFEDTPLRAAARGITWGTLVIIAVVALIQVGRRARKDRLQRGG
ncbi:MAG: hypothetical protein CVU38_14680 [Chloroflexi bacterium HGW-Chloroflexi-1]|nr:MAG: hypothetical protein CVU38_14680 [Chloroflexi bacterium HGW-Chloroflexi-1]